MAAVNSAISFTATGGVNALSGITATGAGNLGLDVGVVVPASTTDQLYTLAIDVSEIQTLFLYTDGALTLETNSSSAPDQTLTFAANKPLVWVYGMPSTNPLTTDVTKFYLTNGTASSVTLYGFINQDL